MRTYYFLDTGDPRKLESHTLTRFPEILRSAGAIVSFLQDILLSIFQFLKLPVTFLGTATLVILSHWPLLGLNVRSLTCCRYITSKQEEKSKRWMRYLVQMRHTPRTLAHTPLLDKGWTMGQDGMEIQGVLSQGRRCFREERFFLRLQWLAVRSRVEGG
ncbi:uncharacterized protein EV420DRAFT_1167065 [Desarmillaria tabescens]|uniref:Uncharacterized protein n=1 Tax=Armillaria tabescens TaxID=1929756 RepID=A0AA39MNB7_ARMTA|nr:uncharacterized protein EV420DRAFT_1167065 [Desarmillaria tabescens]KAK0440014.1 hypothetical protein EV420DRAFT_1167065 [Desarmillaria tabescens]